MRKSVYHHSHKYYASIFVSYGVSVKKEKKMILIIIFSF